MTAPGKIAYSYDEAAEATGYSRDTIKRAVAAGNLPACAPAGKPVIRVEDLDAWLQSAPYVPPSRQRRVS